MYSPLSRVRVSKCDSNLLNTQYWTSSFPPKGVSLSVNKQATVSLVLTGNISSLAQTDQAHQKAGPKCPLHAAHKQTMLCAICITIYCVFELWVNTYKYSYFALKKDHGKGRKQTRLFVCGIMTRGSVSISLLTGSTTTKIYSK